MFVESLDVAFSAKALLADVRNGSGFLQLVEHWRTNDRTFKARWPCGTCSTRLSG